MELESPKYEFLNEEDTKKMLRLFKGERTGWVLVGSKKWFFPYRYTEQGKGFYNFKARSDDTWVLSYPRSGTTWTQELVWLLSNDLDFERAQKELLAERFPFLEFSLFNHPEVTLEFLKINKGDKDKEELCRKIAEPGYEVLARIPSKRFIKSHFPFSLLPGILDTGCKVIYIARNPKDVAVSWYHLNKAIKTQGYTGDFATFWDYFQNNLTPWSPYWEHLKEAWGYKNHPNLLFMFYEEMQHDFPKAIKKVAMFLGKIYSEEQIKEVANYLNIKNFRNNPMVNSSELKECGIITAGTFVRTGQSGNWRDMFTPELDAKANKWIEENLRETDFTFPYFNNINDYQCRYNSDVRQMVTPLHRFQNLNAMENAAGPSNLNSCRVIRTSLRTNNDTRNNFPVDSTQRTQLNNISNNVTTAGNNQLILSNTATSGTNRSLLDFSEFNDAELASYRLRCGVWITFVFATGFVAAAKFYFGDQGQGIEVFVFWGLLTLLLLFACLYSILCRRNHRSNHQEHHVQEDHIASVTATNTMSNENARPISVIRQNPPPPYHIAILIPPHNSSDEAPPPSYDKVMR